MFVVCSITAITPTSTPNLHIHFDLQVANLLCPNYSSKLVLSLKGFTSTSKLVLSLKGFFSKKTPAQ